MTQLEKDQELINLKTQIQMLEDKKRALEAKQVTTYKVWEPEVDEPYWHTISCAHFETMNWPGSPMLKTGLCHPTKEAAERHHSFLVMLHDLHKFAVEHNEGWKPVWNVGTQEKWSIGLNKKGQLYTHDLSHYRCTYYSLPVLPLLKSEELSEKAIDTFGDRLKILFEYYNS